MTRVAFGSSCSPFNLACIIKKAYKENNDRKSEVFEMLNGSIYVYIFYGAESIEEAF